MLCADWKQPFPFRFGAGAEQPHRLSLVACDDPQRVRVEAFIHERFQAMHHADIHHFLPELLALQDAEGTLNAAIGTRPVAGTQAFLEQYLDDPVQQVIAQMTGQMVPRRTVVEVGNLAASSSGSARLLIVAMTWLLAERGLEWVVFTGAASLLNSFHRLGLEPLVLGAADPARLTRDASDWGSYYAHKPQVYAGNIRGGLQRLQRQGVLERLGFPRSVLEAAHAA
jgi:hypothetical protein